MRQKLKNLKSKRFCIHFTDNFQGFFKIDQVVFDLFGSKFLFFINKKSYSKNYLSDFDKNFTINWAYIYLQNINISFSYL